MSNIEEDIASVSGGEGNTTSGIEYSEVPFGSVKRRKLKTFKEYIEELKHGKNDTR